MFKYDEFNQCYSLELHNMIISCDTKPDLKLENYGKKLMAQYDQALGSITRYICMEKEFGEIYGSYSAEQTLELLENNWTIPWIFLQGDNVATIAYCDENYVIEFVVEGCFTAFRELRISS